jgi:hypothetical protein
VAEASVDVRDEAGPREHPPVSDLALWTSVLGGPFLFLLNLEVSYVMVDWACNTGNDWALHVVHLVSLVLSAACALLGLTLLRRVRRAGPDGDRAADARSRLLATVGVLSGTLFAVSVFAQWIGVMVLGTCLRN